MVPADDARSVLGEGTRLAGPRRRALRQPAGHRARRARSTRRTRQVGPDTIAKFLFTSGSTKLPKGVINTQRMLCANQQMLRQCFAFLADEPPVLVDWLPWNHTFGGNHNVGITLYNGGTLYIDDGKPTPARHRRDAAQPARDRADDLLQRAQGLRGDRRARWTATPPLRDTLFSRVKAFMFAGAGLRQPVWDQLDAHRRSRRAASASASSPAWA